MKYRAEFESYLERMPNPTGTGSPVAWGLNEACWIMSDPKDSINLGDKLSAWLVRLLPPMCGVMLGSYLVPLFCPSLPEPTLQFLQQLPLVIGLAVSAAMLISIIPMIGKLRMFRKLRPYAQLAKDIDVGNAYAAVGRIDPTSLVLQADRERVKHPQYNLSGYLKPNSTVRVDFSLLEELYQTRLAGLDRKDIFGYPDAASGWSDFLLVANKECCIICGYTTNHECWISVGDWSFPVRIKITDK